MFADLGGTLPAPTRVLVFMTKCMKILAPIDRRRAHRRSSPSGRSSSTRRRVRNVLDPLKLKAAHLRQPVPEDRARRFSRNLGTMMRSGVPILQALEIVADTTGNVVLERADPGRPGQRAQR